jgi:hypothetical protein
MRGAESQKPYMALAVVSFSNFGMRVVFPTLVFRKMGALRSRRRTFGLEERS